MGEHSPRMVATCTLVVLSLGAAACATPERPPADANTAQVSIDGVSHTLPIDCTQRSWLWTIETLPPNPGFTAMLETGGTVRPRLVRIQSVEGFTGSADSSPNITAGVDGSTFTLSGTAHGAFDAHPTKHVSVRYRLQAHC